MGVSGRQTIVSDSGEAVVKSGEDQEMVNCMMHQSMKISNPTQTGREGGRCSSFGGEGVRQRAVAAGQQEWGLSWRLETHPDAETALALVHHCIDRDRSIARS